MKEAKILFFKEKKTNRVSLQSGLDALEGGDEGEHHVEAGMRNVRQKGSSAVVDSDVAFLDFVKRLK